MSYPQTVESVSELIARLVKDYETKKAKLLTSPQLPALPLRQH